MTKILYLPIETIARELDAKLLLAHCALSRGYSIVTGQKNNVFKAAERLGYGVYMYKSHGLKNFPQPVNTDGKEFICVALDEEGLVFFDDNAYLDFAIPHKLEHLDVVFTWGSYQRNLLIKENPDLKSKTIPVGNPRFDLLRPEFASFYISAKSKLQHAWGKYVLVNTNFAIGNFSRHYGCEYIEHIAHRYIVDIGRPLSDKEKNFVMEKIKYYKELFNQYKKMLVMLSLKFPYLNFILRPHPSEDHENWKEALKGLQNVHTIFEGSVVDWIQGSIAVIHTGCTTGIESWALRKPVIVYNPIPKKGLETELPNKFGINVRNINKLHEVLEDVITGKFTNTFDEQVETAYPFIESIRGKMSTERIMDALDGLVEKRQTGLVNKDTDVYIELRGLESMKRALKFRIVKWIRKHRRAIRILGGKRMEDYIFGKFKKYPGIISQFQKFPELKSGYVRKILSIFDIIFQKKYTGRYSVRKVATDTYIIDNL